MVKGLIKRLLRGILGDYSIYRVLGSGLVAAPQPAHFELQEVDGAFVAVLEDSLLREQAWYGGPESRIFACFEAREKEASLGQRAEPLALCAYWYGPRYAQRNFWPLQPGEAKLVQIITSERARGRGAASHLIQASTAILRAEGWTRLYARVWHSNTPSLRAFERAGWLPIALVLEFHLFGRKSPTRFTRRLS